MRKRNQSNKARGNQHPSTVVDNCYLMLATNSSLVYPSPSQLPLLLYTEQGNWGKCFGNKKLLCLMTSGIRFWGGLFPIFTSIFN